MQAYPLDLLRTRLAAQTTVKHYHGIGQALACIVREEGMGGLYKGLGPTLVQVRGGGGLYKGLGTTLVQVDGGGELG